MNYEDWKTPQKNYDNKYTWNKATTAKDEKAPYQQEWEAKTKTNSENKTVTYYERKDTYRADAWDVDLKVSGINFDTDMTKELMEAKLELQEDCDMDCQKKGSQLTVIATLMGTIYGFVGLNALCMFCGAWVFYCRMASIVCTMVTCLVQFALLITSGVMMMTKYNNVCGRSMTITAQGFRWTMADDFYVTFMLWVASFFTMFGFVCCAMCQCYKSSGGSNTVTNF